MENETIPLDSARGMKILVEWARAHGIVLNVSHRKLAEKHGISTDGVQVAEYQVDKFPRTYGVAVHDAFLQRYGLRQPPK